LRTLYNVLLTLGLPLIILRLIWRGFKAHAYWKRWPERFGFTPKLSHSSQLIWVHAVSFGEVEAARPVIKSLQSDYPNHDILITTMTPTGSHRVKQLYNNSVHHCYLPYDLPYFIKRFLHRTQPQFGIIMETELWPNVLRQCHKLAIPTVLANARMSARSAKGYQRFPGLTRSILTDISLIAAQTEQDKHRFLELGADSKNLHAIGNLKYEISLPTGVKEEASLMRNMWGQDRPVWVAASTHEGEEEIILNAARHVRAAIPNLLLIIVPRHPERFNRVAALSQRSGSNTLRRTENKPCRSDIQTFIVDTMGELPLFYAACDIAFVGGSLVPVGGHNLLEPAALGKPIVTGPHYFNFNDITQSFLGENAVIEVQDSQSLATAVIDILTNTDQQELMSQSALNLIIRSQGASSRLMNLIKYNIK
jgi:3-deoxy-D-manno-octulosonic-acid transferase